MPSARSFTPEKECRRAWALRSFSSICNSEPQMRARARFWLDVAAQHMLPQSISRLLEPHFGALWFVRLVVAVHAIDQSRNVRGRGGGAFALEMANFSRQSNTQKVDVNDFGGHSLTRVRRPLAHLRWRSSSNSCANLMKICCRQHVAPRPMPQMPAIR